jgi:hypothetical protein
MSKIGELLQIRQIKEFAQDLHNGGKAKKTYEVYSAFMQRKYLINAFFGVISVGSATAFFNYYLFGSSEFSQIFTFFSLLIALFLEFVKYFFFNKFLVTFRNEMAAAGVANWFSVYIFGFFSLIFLALSAFLSIQGVTLYSNQSKEKIANLTQKKVSNIVSLDSINQHFELAKNEQKTLFLERETALNAKIAKLKQESNEGGAWSPIAKSNAKTIASIETRILENQTDFSEKISQIDKAKEAHLAVANQKNEANRASLVAKEVNFETEKNGLNWVLTAFCEAFSLIISIFITVLEYRSIIEIRSENPNLKENSDPIVVHDSQSLEVEVFQTKQKQIFLEKKIAFLEQNTQNFENQNFQ